MTQEMPVAVAVEAICVSVVGNDGSAGAVLLRSGNTEGAGLIPLG